MSPHVGTDEHAIPMVGDSGSGGRAGLVPAPPAGSGAAHWVLEADATWNEPASGSGDVVGPASAVDDRIATFDGTTGKLIQDGGATIAGAIASAVAASGDVDGPASAVNNHLAVFDGTSGKLLKDGGAPSVGTGDVVGPSSSVASEAALFDGTTGKLIKRATGTGLVLRTSGVDSTGALSGDFTTSGFVGTLANTAATPGTFGSATKSAVVTIDAKGRVTASSETTITAGAGDVVGPGSAVDGHLAVFDGTTGKLIKDGGAVPAGGGNAFGTVAVSGQSDVVADQANDTLTIVAGANVTITTSAAGDSVTIAASGGGTTGASGGEPGSPAAGDLYFPTDSFFIERYSGSAWMPWGPLFPMTPPVNGDFAWVNQGSASVVTTNGGIYLSTPAEAATTIHIRKQAAPATPWTVTAAFLSNGGPNNGGVGLCYRQSSDGKLVLFQSNFSTGTGFPQQMGLYNFTSPTVFSATVFSGLPMPVTGLIWYRIADNGTNRIVSVATDGVNFIVLNTTARTTFLTANEWGFYVSNTANNFALGMTLLSVKVT